MVRVVFLARKLDPGGAERQLVALARGLAGRGLDVHVVLFYRGGLFDAELAAGGIPVHFLDKQERWDVLGFLVRLVTVLRGLRPSILYSFLDLPNIFAGLIRHAIGSPKLVWSVRSAGMEMHHYDWLMRTIAWFEAVLSGTADIVIANSRAGAACAGKRGFPRDRLLVVENGIDTARFKPDPEGGGRVRKEWNIPPATRLIGLVARLDPMKDHPTFLGACALLAGKLDHVLFVCVGGGTAHHRAEMTSLADGLGLCGRVIWAGMRQDMAAVYSALDIACSSSFGEGFPNVVAEAMACGVPCVVTQVGDSSRIVGNFGEVVPPRDPGALANGIERMLARLEREPELALLARQRVIDNFSLDTMVARTEKCLRSA